MPTPGRSPRPARIPFQRQRYWIDQPPVRASARPVAPVLGPRQVSALSGEVVHQARWDCATHPFIAEHRVYGEVLVPGATYAAMALSAAGLPGRVFDLAFHEPMVFDGDAARLVQLVISRPAEDGSSEFQLFSAADGGTCPGGNPAGTGRGTPTSPSPCGREWGEGWGPFEDRACSHFSPPTPSHKGRGSLQGPGMPVRGFATPVAG